MLAVAVFATLVAMAASDTGTYLRKFTTSTSFKFLLVTFLTLRLACGPGEIYDHPVRGCICVKPGNLIRCPVPPNKKCTDFRLDECNMCVCDASKKSFSCSLKWCSWILYRLCYLNIYENICLNKNIFN